MNLFSRRFSQFHSIEIARLDDRFYGLRVGVNILRDMEYMNKPGVDLTQLYMDGLAAFNEEILIPMADKFGIHTKMLTLRDRTVGVEFFSYEDIKRVYDEIKDYFKKEDISDGERERQFQARCAIKNKISE